MQAFIANGDPLVLTICFIVRLGKTFQQGGHVCLWGREVLGSSLGMSRIRRKWYSLRKQRDIIATYMSSIIHFHSIWKCSFVSRAQWQTYVQTWCVYHMVYVICISFYVFCCSPMEEDISVEVDEVHHSYFLSFDLNIFQHNFVFMFTEVCFRLDIPSAT